MSSITLSTRQASRLVASTTLRPHLPTTTTRSHQTTARTKRALRIRPHASHVLRQQPAGGGALLDEIVFNPPSSQPTEFHTPFKFLPKSDPRRSNNLQLLFNNPAAASTGAISSSAAAAGATTGASAEPYLPPAFTPTDAKRYHITKEQLAEIRQLRLEDPETWSVKKLAAKYDCSTVFIQKACGVTEEYKKKLADDMRRKQATWGPKRLKAREERKQRKALLFDGQL